MCVLVCVYLRVWLRVFTSSYTVNFAFSLSILPLYNGVLVLLFIMALYKRLFIYSRQSLQTTDDTRKFVKRQPIVSAESFDEWPMPLLCLSSCLPLCLPASISVCLPSCVHSGCPPACVAALPVLIPPSLPSLPRPEQRGVDHLSRAVYIRF